MCFGLLALHVDEHSDTSNHSFISNAYFAVFAFLLRRCVNDINNKLTPDVANAYDAFLEKQHEDLAKSLMEQYKKFLTDVKIPMWPTELDTLNKEKLSSFEQLYNESALCGTKEKKTNWLKVQVYKFIIT